MTRSLVIVAALLLALALPRGIVAQTGSVPAVLAGTWSSETNATRALATVVAAFEPGIATLPELFRGFARDRVRTSMVPPSRVEIAVTGSHVHVALYTDRTVAIDGEVGSVATATGTEGSPTVSTGLRGGWLEVRYAGEGDMQQLFSTEPDGSRMHLDFTVHSERLPAPVRYRLDYVRR